VGLQESTTILQAFLQDSTGRFYRNFKLQELQEIISNSCSFSPNKLQEMLTHRNVTTGNLLLQELQEWVGAPTGTLTGIYRHFYRRFFKEGKPTGKSQVIM